MEAPRTTRALPSASTAQSYPHSAATLHMLKKSPCSVFLNTAFVDCEQDRLMHVRSDKSNCFGSLAIFWATGNCLPRSSSAIRLTKDPHPDEKSGSRHTDPEENMPRGRLE